MKIRWFPIENTLIFITIGFPIENTGNFQNFENPWVFKRTFPLELCVGSDGSGNMMSTKHKYNKIFMVLKDFPLGNLVFWCEQNSISQNSEILPFLRFLLISYGKWISCYIFEFWEIEFCPRRKTKSSGGKSLRITKILLNLCFLDIMWTPPSLPIHSSRGYVRL